ncbi:MAG: DUF934 domain-containing protein [Steroidobacteraceae bacterium]
MTPRVLRGGSVLEDDWTLPGAGVARGRTIVPLARWRSERAALLSACSAVGVLLPNTEDVDALYPEIGDRPLIALEFPAFADGRALSQAVVLRTRLKFTGELRAVGDITRDLVFWLGRCGFDAIVPRQDQDLEACRVALTELRVSYQAAADGRTPAWIARRPPAATA